MGDDLHFLIMSSDEALGLVSRLARSVLGARMVKFDKLVRLGLLDRNVHGLRNRRRGTRSERLLALRSIQPGRSRTGNGQSCIPIIICPALMGRREGG